MTQVETDTAALGRALAARWQQSASKLIALAEAVPESSFKSQIVAGVRSCDQLLRHVAQFAPLG